MNNMIRSRSVPFVASLVTPSPLTCSLLVSTPPLTPCSFNSHSSMCLQKRSMYSKRHILGPLDNVDQRGNQLYRLMDKLDREVTMRVWQETCKVVDELNKSSPLERRELPVIFIKEMHYAPKNPDLEYYPPREIPDVIPAGTLMWWSIDDVFERVINPGYALFATAENVREYCSEELVSTSEGADSAEQVDSYNDPALRDLLQSTTFHSSAPVTRCDVLRFLRDELNLHVPTEHHVLLSQQLTEPGEYEVPIRINSKHREVITLVVS